MNKLSLYCKWTTTLGLIASTLACPVFAEQIASSFGKNMNPIVEKYLQIQSALAADSMIGIADLARDIAKLAEKLDSSTLKDADAAHFKPLPGAIKEAAEKLALTKNLESARKEFKQLSNSMTLWGRIQKPVGIQVVSCSMAQASWLQKVGEIRNPYYGKSMLGCGEVEGKADACCQGKHGH
ncbi:DUF3347 domain-containing protein [Bdellovibrionota bacterium FG-2]